MTVGGNSFDSLIETVFGVLMRVGIIIFIQKPLNWLTSVPLYSIIISLVVCVASGLFFRWYPAIKASALDSTTVLRYE